MAVNVRGVFLGCKHAIPRMVEQGSGSVINVASFVALLGCSVPQDAYTASKGAILALTRSLAVQFGPQRRSLEQPQPRSRRDAAPARLARQGRGGEADPPRAQPDGTLREARGDREPLRCTSPRTNRAGRTARTSSSTAASASTTSERVTGTTAAPVTARMVIGGELVDAADGRTAEVADPAHAVTLASVPLADATDVDRAVVAAQRGVRGSLVASPGRRAWPPARTPRRRRRRQRGGAGLARVPQRRQAHRRGALGDRRGGARLRVLRRCPGAPGGRDHPGREARSRPHAARADRGRGAHRAVELPAPHRLVEARSGLGRGQHVRAQARLPDAPRRRCASRSSRSRPACPPVSSTS